MTDSEEASLDAAPVRLLTSSRCLFSGLCLDQHPSAHMHDVEAPARKQYAQPTLCRIGRISCSIDIL